MKKALIITLLGLAAGMAQAGSYYEVHDWDTILNGNEATSHFSAVSDGENTYHILSLGNQPAITKVDADGNATTLVSSLDWAFAAGTTAITAMQSVSLYRDKLIFAETGTDAVWSVDTNTGALSVVASKANIDSYIGGTGPSLLSAASCYKGNMYFYEGDTDSILVTNSVGYVETYITDTQLASVAGTDTVSGGISFDNSGNLIWGVSESSKGEYPGGIYSWNCSDGGSVLLTDAEIAAVTGATGAMQMGDILYAPDGLVYFFESRSDSILSFDLSDPAGTLTTVLSEADLLAGPAEYDNVYKLSWYDGNLAFNENGARGYYAVPEPMTMSLIGLGGLALIRKRR